MKKIVLLLFIISLLTACSNNDKIKYNDQVTCNLIYPVETTFDPLNDFRPIPPDIEGISCYVNILLNYEKHPKYNEWIEQNQYYIYHDQTNPNSRIKYLCNRFIIDDEIVNNINGSTFAQSSDSICISYSSISLLMKDYDFYDNYTNNEYVIEIEFIN